jgi:hypothetical protein
LTECGFAASVSKSLGHSTMIRAFDARTAAIGLARTPEQLNNVAKAAKDINPPRNKS